MKKTLKNLLVLVSLLSAFSLVGCGKSKSENVLRVGMECGYAPYNWTQSDDSNGAVPIEGSKEFANGYDIMFAKKVAEGLGKELSVVKIDWDGLAPAVQSGTIDLVMAGMSPTKERQEVIDFTSAYWKSDLIMVVKKDSAYANATSLSDFKGAKVTGQLNTVHYSVIDQIPGAQKVEAMQDFNSERVALKSGIIDAYVAELPEGLSVEKAIPEFTYIKFEDGKGFVASDEDLAVAAGLSKGSKLKEDLNKIIDSVSDEERQEMMKTALETQPISEE